MSNEMSELETMLAQLSPHTWKMVMTCSERLAALLDQYPDDVSIMSLAVMNQVMQNRFKEKGDIRE